MTLYVSVEDLMQKVKQKVFNILNYFFFFFRKVLHYMDCYYQASANKQTNNQKDILYVSGICIL